jgi:hypothetical protein
MYTSFLFVPFGLLCVLAGVRMYQAGEDGWLGPILIGVLFVLSMAFFAGVAKFGKRFAGFGLSLLTIGAGITLVTVCIRSYGPHWWLAWNGERTEGKVTTVKIDGRPESVVEYEVDGEKHRIAAQSDTQSRFTRGESVRVVYRADQPADAMIYSTEAIWVVPILATVVGVFFIGFGIIMFLASIAPLVIRRVDKALENLEAKAAEYDDLPPHLR